jgi:hypothetical protein
VSADHAADRRFPRSMRAKEARAISTRRIGTL